MNVKKQYEDLVSFLEANSDKKVKTILEQIYEMTASSKRASTVYRNAEGEVVAVFCYYHKRWELVSEVEYGRKANSQTGLNTLCKIGASKWTKAQRDAKKAKEDLLANVANGTVAANQLQDTLADIENRRQEVDMSDAPAGFAELDDVIAHLS